jgi:uncharacterized protein
LLTIAANFWPRRLDLRRFPGIARLHATAPGVQVLVHSHEPQVPRLGDIVLVHGLEGCGDSPYMLSTAQAALEAGFAAHRFNMRSCGGTEALCDSMYNAGLTDDLLAFTRVLLQEGRGPVFLAGFSLGGNVVLKLAGDLGEGGPNLLGGVCAISAPIDLSASAGLLSERQNRIYELRFLRRLKQRMRIMNARLPERFPLDGLDRVETLLDFDDRFTARCSGFQDAADYYYRQSAVRVLDRVRVPALLIQAKDDPVIPFSSFSHPALCENPSLRLIAVEHGGHLGFLSRRKPRFWDAETALEWFVQLRNKDVSDSVI